MPLNVAQFISNLTYDGARPNLFNVTLTFPSGISGDSNYASFMIKAASLPAAEIGMAEVPYFGRKIKLYGNRTFASWNITVINDEDFKIRDMFERWSGGINSHVGNVMRADWTRLYDYSATATITQYDKNGGAHKQYDMVGAWPSSISAIEMAWDSNNSVEDFQVTMEYQWWEASTTDHSSLDNNVGSALSTFGGAAAAIATAARATNIL